MKIRWFTICISILLSKFHGPDNGLKYLLFISVHPCQNACEKVGGLQNVSSIISHILITSLQMSQLLLNNSINYEILHFL